MTRFSVLRRVLWTSVPALLSAFVLMSGAAFGQAVSTEVQEASKLLRAGQHQAALERVNKVLASRPRDAQARFLKGLIFAEQGNTREATDIFVALTKDYPDLPEPYNNLAVLYASQGQYDKARSALEMAIRTHPSYATAHENLGDIYAKMASQAYDKALQLDKSNTAAQTKLNLIKDLFSANPPAPKPAVTGKAEPPVKVAVAAPKAAEKVAVAPPASKAPDKAAPAAKAAPKEAAPKAGAARNPDEVLRAVNEWAQAWSGNDVDGYLAH